MGSGIKYTTSMSENSMSLSLADLAKAVKLAKQEITAVYPTVEKEQIIVFKTQKARGLETGWSLSSHAGSGYKVAPYDGVLPHMGAEKKGTLTFPKFARPCPTEPRHGFVESRNVNSQEELDALFKETLAHDPNGELIVMDRLSGQFSAIMTAAGVSWGLSNDGVTSGKGETRVIPTPPGKFDNLFLASLGVKPADVANTGVYCELVEDKGAVYVVQMRLGPKQPDSRVKRHTRTLVSNVHRVIVPVNDDLIAWDTTLSKMDNLCMSGNILVWLPGQAMSSHFAVQAIAKGYLVSVEDECPVDKVKGGVLRAAPNQIAPISEADYGQVAAALEREKKVKFWDFPRDVLLSVGILHSLPYWDNRPHLLALRARGAMLAARYGLAACLGESRHKIRFNGYSGAKVNWKKLMGYGDSIRDVGRPSRSYVFVRAFELPWEDCADYAMAASIDMRLGSQPPVMEHLAKGGKLGDYSASYMGQKWEYAALRVHDLCVAIDKFCASSNEGNWGAVLGNYNEIINAAHNGGYLLNKWCSHSLIDNAALAPALVFGFRNVMNLVWQDMFETSVSCPWVSLTKMPSGQKSAHKKVGGIYIPQKVWDTHIRGECLCAACMPEIYVKIGNICAVDKTPCYVPDDMLNKMPTINVTTIKEKAKPEKKECEEAKKKKLKKKGKPKAKKVENDDQVQKV